MKLDKEQEEAANYTDRNSIIIAGAGTGKTTTLLKKIDVLVKMGVKEKNILVISFTNETVNNFRTKCAFNIDVYTFHKIAMILSNNTRDIIDNEFLLNDLIKNYLLNTNIKVKKNIFHYYNGITSMYTEKKYLKMLENDGYNSVIKEIFRIITYAKCNKLDLGKVEIKKFLSVEKLLLYIALKIVKEYNQILNENNFCDFDDLIINATNQLQEKKANHYYKYILVDEFQDISLIRLEFLQELVRLNNSILTVVGDDFQSIYGFSGSNISLFYNCDKYFPDVKKFFIRTTYRCPQEVVSKAGKFIMKNNLQIKKNLTSNNQNKGVIHKLYYNNKKKSFKKLLTKLLAKNKSVLIISRNNYDIYNYIDNSIEFKNGYLIYKKNEYKNIRFMSIHSSKGLEADIVVILNLSNSLNGLPSKKMSNLLSKTFPNDEKYPFAEERRLFYVALTRCRNDIYLLIDINSPSRFVREI